VVNTLSDQSAAVHAIATDVGRSYSQGRIAVVHRSFSRISQVAPTSTPSDTQRDSDAILFHLIASCGISIGSSVFARAADFCRRLIGKNSEKCFSLRQRLYTLRYQVIDRMDIF